MDSTSTSARTTHPDIELRNSDFHAQVCETLQVRLEVLRHGTNDEMALESNTVDEVLGDEVADYSEERVGFGVDGFDVEVVLGVTYIVS